MFSIMTMASSTTNPVAMVSAIKDRLFRLNPRSTMAPKVPTRDSGTATAGMTVAARLRRGLDHGVGHFRPLSLTRQRRLLAYHDIAINHEDLCQVFRQLFLTATHWILIA